MILLRNSNIPSRFWTRAMRPNTLTIVNNVSKNQGETFTAAVWHEVLSPINTLKIILQSIFTVDFYLHYVIAQLHILI